MSEDLEPIACRMDALTAEERSRRAEVVSILEGRLIGREETDDGLAFRLPSDPDVAALAREFIGYESRCCPFLRFDLQEGKSGPLVLRMGGRPGVKEFLKQAFP